MSARWRPIAGQLKIVDRVPGMTSALVNPIPGSCPLPKQQPSGTPGKKLPAPSVQLRLARTPLEQRSGSKPLGAIGTTAAD
jgi:hypothetical protein